MKFEVGPQIRLDLRLEQKIIAKLVAKLEQRVGNFERQILAKAEFIDIDFEGTGSNYHIEMLGSLVVRESEGDSLIAQAVKSLHKEIDDIEKVVVESFSLGDISFDIGQNRNVDAITVVFSGNEAFTMTVSLDKKKFVDIRNSPSFKEAEILKGVDPAKVWAVQRYFGSSEVKYPRTLKKGFLICKEFIEGEMLGNITSDLRGQEMIHGKPYLENLAYATGKAAANILTELHGIPLDSNPLNLIVNNTDNEGLIVRYCDIEELRTSQSGIDKEIDLMAQEFGPFAGHFRRSIEENHKK